MARIRKFEEKDNAVLDIQALTLAEARAIYNAMDDRPITHQLKMDLRTALLIIEDGFK